MGCSYIQGGSTSHYLSLGFSSSANVTLHGYSKAYLLLGASELYLILAMARYIGTASLGEILILHQLQPLVVNGVLVTLISQSAEWGGA